MFLYQQFGKRLSEGESHDGWVTLMRSNDRAELELAMNRKYHDKRKRTERIIEAHNEV